MTNKAKPTMRTTELRNIVERFIANSMPISYWSWQSMEGSLREKHGMLAP
jgi:hypothetical protein